MNKILIALAGSAALVASTAGFAGGPDNAVSPVDSFSDNSAGLYLSGNVGYGHSDFDTDNLDAVGLNVDRNSFAWSANVGYQFNPYIAVEAGYMQLPRVKITGDALGNAATTIRLKTDAWTLAAKGIYPINEQFDLFAKAGVALESQTGQVTFDGTTVTSTNDSHQLVPLFGLGVDYNITQNWAVGLQGITTIKGGDNYPATYTGLVGVTYKFT